MKSHREMVCRGSQMRVALAMVFTACLMMLTGCGRPIVGAEYPVLQAAIHYQSAALEHPEFKTILGEIDAANGISWKPDNVAEIKDLDPKESKVQWAFRHFEKDGPFRQQDVSLWYKWNPFSSTTADTATCGKTTRINQWNISDDVTSLVNTLVHERLHSFCMNHADGQSRASNMCDMAYVSGDLAQAIVQRSLGSPVKIGKEVCPALCAALANHQMPNACVDPDH